MGAVSPQKTAAVFTCSTKLQESPPPPSPSLRGAPSRSTAAPGEPRHASVQHRQPEQQQEVPPSTLVCVERESMYSSPGHSPAIFCRRTVDILIKNAVKRTDFLSLDAELGHLLHISVNVSGLYYKDTLEDKSRPASTPHHSLIPHGRRTSFMLYSHYGGYELCVDEKWENLYGARW